MTAYEMRISDWSSDVCSSDLAGARAIERDALALDVGHGLDARLGAHHQVDGLRVEVGDGAQGLQRSTGEEQFLAVIGPVGDVRLHEAGFQSPLLDLAGVVHRRAGRLCDRNQAGDAATAAALAVAAARRAG